MLTYFQWLSAPEYERNDPAYAKFHERNSRWSPQQSAFIDWAVNGKGSCVLEAVAGAGKTTVLLEAAMRMPGTVALMAFNRKIATEIKDKLKELGVDGSRKIEAGTVHAFGRSAFKKYRGKKFFKVDNYKVANIVEGLLPENHPLNKHSDAITKLVSLAKQTALGIFGSVEDVSEWFAIADYHDVFESNNGPLPVEELVAMSQQVLKASNNNLDIIDFDDMIYLPLLLRLPFWQFDNVMIDEAQDTNAARRALVRALVKKGGRVMAVGDQHQAIYGFTGADADSLDLIAKDFNCQRLPLTITYRCPKTVVAFSQQWVSHITAADTAPEGTVTKTILPEFFKRNDLDGEAAVLCRVTKPLVSLAFQLIRKRIPCRIEGRDIAEQIKKLIKRWKVSSLDALEAKLDDYLARETTKLLAKKQEAKLAVVEDSVETIRVIIDQCRAEDKETIDEAIAYVDAMFSDDVKGLLVLSTIHKAKGREWELVFWLDRTNTCPSKWARQAWQQGQEVNLMYVAATRAKSELIELALA
jgi:DNA helicase-2/ATP-dependent DNA helicase PcrA